MSQQLKHFKVVTNSVFPNNEGRALGQISYFSWMKLSGELKNWSSKMFTLKQKLKGFYLFLPLLLPLVPGNFGLSNKKRNRKSFQFITPYQRLSFVTIFNF